MDLINKLKEIDIIKYGHFTLKSGEKSNIYVDLRNLIGHPMLLKEISYEFGKLISYKNIVLVGVPLGGLQYAFTISSIYNIPMIMIREDKKNYGLKNIIEGNLFDRDCVIVEDVITTGNSILNIIKKLEHNNISVAEIIVLLDREKGGIDMLKHKGYKVHALFKLTELLINHQCIEYKNKTHHKIDKLCKIMSNKRTNLIFSADLTKPKDILNIIDDIGKYVCCVKIHIDIINFENYQKSIFCDELNKLKKKHNFMIIEDRKYSDIGAIVDKQIQLILKWADIVTAYGITGPDMIKVLDDNNIGILLIYQLSTKNNLIDRIHSCKIKDLAKKYNNIIGFICQEKVLDGYLHCSPGVNINVSCDTLGQQYNTPEILSKKGINLFIVGKGIYQNKDPISSAKEYKNKCWNLKN